jgi:hypothetical protein
MVSAATASDACEPEVLDHWTARKIQPVILLYVTAVFVAFMLMAYFLFHSIAAVKALAIGCIGAIAATVPGVMEKVEYRMTESGLAKRTLKRTTPGPFEDVFRWEELSHIVPMKHGFKYFKTLNETSPVHRFWKVHTSDRYSDEVHVEKGDLDRILGISERQGISTRGSR